MANSTDSRADSTCALLFDLDGTLVDTAPDLAGALNGVLREHGRETLEVDQVKILVGDGAVAMIERGFEASGGLPDTIENLRLRFLEIYAATLTRHSRPYPGVVATLERFHSAGHPMAVCTNKPQAPSEAILDGLDLVRFFGATAGGDRFPVRKPDAGHITGLLELIGASAAVMIGDSMNDVAAARAADIPVIAVSYGYTVLPAAEFGADAVVDSFDEIPAALAALPGLG